MATEYNWNEDAHRQKAQVIPPEYEWDSDDEFGCYGHRKLQDDFRKAVEHSRKYREDIMYLRSVIRDCLVFAGCEPSTPRAERRIHGIDFVTSILDALRSTYDATNQYPDKAKQDVESAIREKIRKEMDIKNGE